MHGERYVFCATVRQELLPARALPGALPSGVRTFLPPSPFRASARQARESSPYRGAEVRRPAVVWLVATNDYPIDGLTNLRIDGSEIMEGNPDINSSIRKSGNSSLS